LEIMFTWGRQRFRLIDWRVRRKIEKSRNPVNFFINNLNNS